MTVRRGWRATVLAVVLATVGAQSALAATAVPFNYTVDFKVNLRGRDMTSANGNFCNKFRTTFVQRPDLDKTVWIQLWKVVIPFDDPVGVKVAYGADGIWRKFCWNGFNPGATYFFRYTKNNNTFTIRGEGSATAS